MNILKYRQGSYRLGHVKFKDFSMTTQAIFKDYLPNIKGVTWLPNFQIVNVSIQYRPFYPNNHIDWYSHPIPVSVYRTSSCVITAEPVK